jgi:hypothetical protein
MILDPETMRFCGWNNWTVHVVAYRIKAPLRLRYLKRIACRPFSAFPPYITSYNISMAGSYLLHRSDPARGLWEDMLSKLAVRFIYRKASKAMRGSKKGSHWFTNAFSLCSFVQRGLLRTCEHLGTLGVLSPDSSGIATVQEISLLYKF